eukprot:2353027-Pyramimonas_sp.AAC.2
MPRCFRFSRHPHGAGHQEHGRMADNTGFSIADLRREGPNAKGTFADEHYPLQRYSNKSKQVAIKWPKHFVPANSLLAYLCRRP